MENLTVLRIDDIPLLYEQVKELNIQGIIDSYITPHKNWSGLSIGYLVQIWLCYLLSESDHRLCVVEQWVARNLPLLQLLSAQKNMRSHDFTDDRLEKVLDYLSKSTHWASINTAINSSSLQVYSLSPLASVRLDAAPIQGHHKLEANSLFQRGYSKHHNGNLGMIKVMLATLDNNLNSFAYPLAHLTVQGSKADDGLYVPIIQSCQATLQAKAQSESEDFTTLYVGDSKMGSQATRTYIHQQSATYLHPLSHKLLSKEERQIAINSVAASTYHKVYKDGKNDQRILVAQGFEKWVDVKYKDQDGQMVQWRERNLYVLSTAYANSQHKALDKRINKAKQLLDDLLVSKQGKRALKSIEAVEDAVNKVLTDNKVEHILSVSIHQTQEEKQVRAYKNNPARVEKKQIFSLSVQTDEQAIAQDKQMLGWQVYATNTSIEQLDFEKCVWKYRYQNRIEQRFDDLRNKVVPLMPVFLKKDNRIKSLINVLMICLKVCTIMEYKVAKKLKQNKESIANLYEGNAKRTTQTPTASRMLKAFKDVSLVILAVLAGKQNLLQVDKASNPNIVYIQVTKLNQTQEQILDLIGFNRAIYEQLDEKMKIFFSS